MNVIRRRGWEMPESRATPSICSSTAGPSSAPPRRGCDRARARHRAGAARHRQPDPSIDLYPAKRNEKYTLDRPVTDEKINGNYNNFYEFNSSKRSPSGAGAEDPAVDHQDRRHGREANRDRHRRSGAQVRLEERLYRHRCVEAWSMAIPWSGFPMSKLVELAKPLSSAKYVRMETFLDKSIAPGQKQSWYPVALCRGPHHGGGDQRTRRSSPPAPTASRSPSSTARRSVWRCRGSTASSTSSRSCAFTFTDKRPKSYWEDLQASEYGFWANVNPEVPHPRWSQASEELIGTGERRPTLLFNGYGEYVADLYKGLEEERLWA